VLYPLLEENKVTDFGFRIFDFGFIVEKNWGYGKVVSDFFYLSFWSEAKNLLRHTLRTMHSGLLQGGEDSSLRYRMTKQFF
jgi:hypothetical protein